MTYDSTFSPDAARHNQLDQRLNGILDYDERNTRVEGQAALEFGSGNAGIELDIEGANCLINGSKISVPPNTVTLSDGDSSGEGLYRTDHIYATEAGNFSVAEGEPGDNRYVVHEIDDSGTEPAIEHSIEESLRAGGPAPKGPSFAAEQGELLWTVLVPPGATTAADLNENHIFNRRRVAIDLLDLEEPRTPGINAREVDLAAGEWVSWPIITDFRQTLRIWSYCITVSRFGMVNTNNFRVYLVDHSAIDGGIPVSEFDDGIEWSDYAVWESGQTRQFSRGDPDDLIVDIDMAGNADSHLFVLENDSDVDYTGEEARVGLSVTYSVENTEDL